MKTKRRNANRRSRRSKKGGFGGWPRTTTVGPAWDGQNGGNHFKFAQNGVLVGGIQSAVPEINGPGLGQINRLVPPLSQKSLSMGGGGSKRSHSSKRTHKKGRSRRGGSGLILGGFPNNFQIAFDNAKIALQNGYRGLMGYNQLTPASPWVQPGLASSKVPHMQTSKPYVIDAARKMMHHGSKH
jgi:hypothetical protein